jgi:hypothetical protein
MVIPSKYKSISTTDLKSKPIIALTASEKTKVNVILQRLTTLIKLKHS